MVEVKKKLKSDVEKGKFVKNCDNCFPANEEPKVLGNVTEDKYKILLNFDEAPEYLKFNPYIRTGYRSFLSTKLCVQSIFWWTNETVNIWSHLFGYLLFLCLTISDFNFLKTRAESSDQIILICLLICFQMCMLLSTVYHVFSCKSEKHYDMFLSVDFFGIVLSLIAIYISGMYYAFWCLEKLRVIYTTISVGIFILAMCTMIPKFNISLKTKIGVLLLWAAYGVIPITHLALVAGGMENPLVELLIPRIFVMYLLCGVAFLIYATQIPERWFSGKVDFFGHSHNWWHLFILAAFYHWHNTGIRYAEFRSTNTCSVIHQLS